jgi:peptidyl-prolyl cis-trans isomerase SurA
MAYALKPGETSELFRNKKGWHFFRLIDKRKSLGKWRVAQILFCFPPNADAAEKGRIQAKADSIYALLKSGNEFAALARSYSEDRLTSTNGGEMPEFGVGKYDPAFMQVVARLQKDGDVSTPFATSHGFHIVKRIAYTPQPDSLTDELLVYEIKQKLMQDARLKESRDAFAKEVMKKVGCKNVKGLNTEDLYRYADSALQHADVETYCDSTPISKKIILQFTKGNMKGSDWLRFARDARLNAEQYREETFEQLWSSYPAIASMEFYRAHLEDYNADFAFQLKEFKEGNMLFDVMEKQVWGKATNDSVGLKKYFDEHRNDYTWNESVDVLVFNCNSTNAAHEVQQKLSEGINWRRVLEMKMDEVQGDSGRFELNQIGLNMVSGKMSGKFSDITVNQDGTATFMQYLDFHAKGELRSFEQAKGIAINEYQAVLEKKWLDELRKKYPVKVNNAVVESVIKQL